MNEEMSRKDFLLRIAGIVLLLSGLSGMLHKMRSIQVQTQGYGASTYGGTKRGQ